MINARAAVTVLCILACGPSTQTPGVSADAFDGPGDQMTPPEEVSFTQASDAVMKGTRMQTCMQRSYRAGIAGTEVTARIQFRKDGHITAIGFKSKPPNDSVADFLACARAVLAQMDLKGGPWEADRKVVYKFTTTMITD